MGRLHVDLFLQNKFLINGVDVKIRLMRSKSAFALVAPMSTRTDVPEVTFRALIVIIRNDVFSPSDSMLSIIMFITVACYATLYM